MTQEIVELHRFFEDWFGGRIGDSPQEFARLEMALMPTFRIITPEGALMHRSALVPAIQRGYGKRPGLEIEIRDVTMCAAGPGFVLANYEEWQVFEGETTARLSTVHFQPYREAPNGLRWFHVHETWMDLDAEEQG